jgi:MerR family Zn(II)-responsive transcriptional regulator of zntA
MKYTRKALAKELGIGAESLRHYENIDLIAPPLRASNGYRLYSEEDLIKIRHILIAKKYGFSLKEIKTIFNLAENSEFNCDDIKPFLKNKVLEIDDQIKVLKGLKSLILDRIQSL